MTEKIRTPQVILQELVGVSAIADEEIYNAIAGLSAYYKSQEPKRLGVEEITKILMEQMPIQDWESLSEHRRRLAQAIVTA